MNAFVDPLIIRALSPMELAAIPTDVAMWEVCDPFTYISNRLGGIVTVPAGFTTDFASIPRAVWATLSPDDPVILFPSVIHDYLYSVKGVLPDGRVYSREDADAVLREGMEECGAFSALREIVYESVRMGGGSHWAKPVQGVRV